MGPTTSEQTLRNFVEGAFGTLPDKPVAVGGTWNRETPTSEAFERMTSGDLNQLPVVSEGHVEGVVSRGSILRVLQQRASLGT